MLFVDGGRLPLRQLRAGWRLSGRALGLGMPLTLVLIAVATRFLVGLDWTTALLGGAILSPTDPMFASTVVSRSEVPRPDRDRYRVQGDAMSAAVPGESTPIAAVRQGMTVVDLAGERVGVVQLVRAGEPEAAVSEDQVDGGLVAEARRAFRSGTSRGCPPSWRPSWSVSVT